LTFHRAEDDSDDYELSDHEINKLLIVTQAVDIPQTSLPSRIPKHDGHDRSGDKSTRVKMSQDLAQVINDGLNYYEDDLWNDTPEWVCTNGLFSDFYLKFNAFSIIGPAW
jgi:la-related protein 1